MKLYSEDKNYKIYNGNMLDMLEVIDKESIDSIITDPPYELNFMGKGWDNSGISFNKYAWKKCYDVLKPGGYLLAFGGSRTFHRIACAIEDASFKIRDTIMWLYSSGFPKGMNIGLAIDKKNGVESTVVGKLPDNTLKVLQRFKEQDGRKTRTKFDDIGFIKQAQNEWAGWGTCLKPAFEPIIIARKPFKGSLVDNVIKYGVGGLNIDECRVKTDELKGKVYNSSGNNLSWGGTYGKGVNYGNEIGRYPANIILTYDDIDFNEVCGGFPITNKESSSRYFYCSKASKRDRDEGLDEFELKTKIFNGKSNNSSKDMKGLEKRFTTIEKNTHPTVKPTSLMQYLVRLVSPKGATIMDCFMGSGSTGKAVMYENKDRQADYKFIGIELTEEYLPIAKARIDYVCNLEEKKEEDNQTTIFDYLDKDEL